MKSYFYKNYAFLQHLSWKCVPGQRSYSRDRARTTGAMQSELLHIIRDLQAEWIPKDARTLRLQERA